MAWSGAFRNPRRRRGPRTDFYSSAFGWERKPHAGDGATPWSSPRRRTNNGHADRVPGAINGGMFRREGDLTSPVITVDVEDIDATLAKVESLGGSTVTPRQDIGSMGFYAYFRDTEGNVVGLWQNAPRREAPAPRRMTSAPDAADGHAVARGRGRSRAAPTCLPGGRR